MTALFHSTAYVYGPRIRSKSCQQVLEAVFFPYLLKEFNEEPQPPQASALTGSIASVRIVNNDPPAERLVLELSGKWPELRFVLVKNDLHGAESQTVEYQAGCATSPMWLEPDHLAEPSAGGRDAATTLLVTSPERGPGTAGLLSVAVQHLIADHQLSQHVFVWQNQYGGSGFSRIVSRRA